LIEFRYVSSFKRKTKGEAGYLSGGEQQMLAIGSALMSEPELFIT
jgi:ABC-type branched-subunit amino acid transport system ATPase component